MTYDDFEHLKIEHREGVVVVTINRPEILNAANARMHWELGEVWRCFAEDPDGRVAVVTGAGAAFSAGAELNVITAMQNDPVEHERQYRHTAALVTSMLDCPKPIISAINGVAVGAGLVVALMADISIAADDARLTDGHARIGIAAGDHAALAWPLLCGMAKAKYYLLTADFISGRDAAEMGLVTNSVPADELMSTALEIAERLARGSQVAQQATKRALNQWYRMAFPIFEASLAAEMMNVLQEDASEGVAAMLEKRPAMFPSARR